MIHSYISTESCTLMTSLVQICLLSKLTNTIVQWCGFWVGVVGTTFFTRFAVVIYLGMIKISKGVGMSKRERIKYQRGRETLFSNRSKLMPQFIPVFPDTTVKERCLG